MSERKARKARPTRMARARPHVRPELIWLEPFLFKHLDVLRDVYESVYPVDLPQESASAVEVEPDDVSVQTVSEVHRPPGTDVVFPLWNHYHQKHDTLDGPSGPVPPDAFDAPDPLPDALADQPSSEGGTHREPKTSKEVD